MYIQNDFVKGKISSRNILGKEKERYFVPRFLMDGKECHTFKVMDSFK